MSTAMYFALQVVLALVLAPLLLGVINRTKAVFAGRHGKPFLQTYYDLARLLGKGEVISQTATWTFSAGPAVGLACCLAALCLLPLGGIGSPLAFGGDFILAAYLLGMGRFAQILAALDTGSSFEGMGASREAAFSALAEPVFFLAFLVLSSFILDMQFPAGAGVPPMRPAVPLSGDTTHRLASCFSLSAMLGGNIAGVWLLGRLELLLIPAVFFVLLLVENCRIPMDDPTTHLELTMIHEVMVLDHSGPNLAMKVYGSALKLWFFASIIAGLLVPALPLWQQMALHLAVIFTLAVLVGVVESVMARLRLVRIPQMLGGAGALAALALILTQAR